MRRNDILSVFRRPGSVLISSMVYLAIGVVLYSFPVEIAEAIGISDFIVKIVGIVSFFAGFGVILFGYLAGDLFFSRFLFGPNDFTDQSTIAPPYFRDHTERRLEKLETSYNELVVLSAESSTNKEIDIDALLKSVKEQAVSDLPRMVIDDLKEQFSEQLVSQKQIDRVRASFFSTEGRLKEQLYKAGRRSSANLAIGMITTAAAAIILGYIAFEQKPALDTMPPLLAHYIPRLATIVFVEVFAFFFLRLYRAGIQEGKYFQNELTNVEHKSAAFEASLIAEHTPTTTDVIRQLIRTDRSGLMRIEGVSGDPALSLKDATTIAETVSKFTGKS